MSKYIDEINLYLPVFIEEVNWDGTILHMCGSKWGFNTLSAWRIIRNNEIIIGCYDECSSNIAIYTNFSITEAKKGSNIRDITFILSNKDELQILATILYEPWLLHLNDANTSFIP